MRDLYDVITQMLKVIPKDSGLYDALLDNQSSVEFAAPELVSMWWHEAADNLAYYIKEHIEPWHLEVFRIWKGNTNI